MMPFRLPQLGSAIDAIGHAAAPAASPPPQRSPSPRLLAPTFRSAYGDASGLDMFARCRDEALVERGRAIEYRQEAAAFGGAVGFVIGMVAGAWLRRSTR